MLISPKKITLSEKEVGLAIIDYVRAQVPNLKWSPGVDIIQAPSKTDKSGFKYYAEVYEKAGVSCSGSTFDCGSDRAGSSPALLTK